MHLSGSQKSLITQLASVLYACVNLHKDKESWCIPSQRSSGRLFSEICETLWKLNLAKITNGDSGYLMEFSRYIDAPEMIQITSNISMDGYCRPELTSSDNIESVIDFSNFDSSLNQQILLEQFLLCMNKLGLTQKIPVSRKLEFGVLDKTLLKAMNALAENGFVVQKDNEFQWTDKIAVHMISRYLWTQDEVIESRIDHGFVAGSLERLKSNTNGVIPLFSRPNISTSTSLGMTITLLEHWDGRRWHNEVLENPIISFENAMGTADGFLNIYQPVGRNDDKQWEPKRKKSLSADERRLVTSLVKGIHRWWDTVPREDEQWSKDGYIFHYYAKTFSLSAKILWTLGLAKAAWPSNNLYDISYVRFLEYYINPQNLIFAPLFKPVPKSQIDQNIGFEHFYPGLSILDILSSFLELASDYGGNLCVERHKKFIAPHEDYELALNSLVEFGYAEKISSSYKWTDKISPAMIKKHFWGEANFTEENVDQETVNKMLSGIIENGVDQIPREFRDGYLGRPSDTVLGFSFGLLQYWTGKSWSKDHVYEPIISFDNAIAIARAFLKKFKHNEDWNNHHWVEISIDADTET